MIHKPIHTAFTRDNEPSSQRSSPFITMDITADPNGICILLDNCHKSSRPNDLNVSILKKCGFEISPVLTVTYDGSVVGGLLQDD